MTTIAWDGERMAADTLAGGRFRAYKSKISRVEMPDGSVCLVGAAGDSYACAEHVEWLRRGAIPSEFPVALRDESCPSFLLVVTQDRQVCRYERGPYPVKVRAGPHALGSGCEFAMAAMFLGKTAPEAVAVAAHFDSDTGGEIEVVTL